MHSSDVLTSWKEIAAHLGKGVRTVQRWERELGLPVRRPVGKSKHVVLAVPSELDVWVARGFAARDSARRSHPPSDTFRHRVLLVDDDKKFLQITKALLEAKEFEVLTAEKGEFSSVNVPPRVMSDAYFEKGAYSPSDFLNKVAELVSQTPMRPSGASCLSKPRVVESAKPGADALATGGHADSTPGKIPLPQSLSSSKENRGEA